MLKLKIILIEKIQSKYTGDYLLKYLHLNC